MPIQTIDHYLVAPRSQEASQVKQHDAAKVPHEQGNLQIQSEKQTRAQAEKTVRSGETENKEGKYDARDKGKGTYEKQEQKRKQEEEQEKELLKRTGIGGSLFDIKI